MTDKTIFAYTEPISAPGYINIKRDTNGKHLVTVRSRGMFEASVLELTPELLDSIALYLIDYLHSGDPTPMTEEKRELAEVLAENAILREELEALKKQEF